MAIKGKARARGRKVVTSGRRPAYTPVKRPILARRGFWIGVLVVLVVGAVAGVGYGLAKERTRNREQALRERARTAAVAFQGKVEGAIAGVGQPAPPDGFTAFPTLSADATGLAKGTVKAGAAASDAKAAQQTAEGAATALDNIDVLSLTAGKGFDAAFVNYFFNAKEKLADALHLYGHAAALVRQAAGSGGDGRAGLLERATGILSVAGRLMNSGYSDYIQVQQRARIFQPTFPTQQSGS